MSTAVARICLLSSVLGCPSSALAQHRAESDHIFATAIEFVRARRRTRLQGVRPESIVVQPFMVVQLRPLVLDSIGLSRVGKLILDHGFQVANDSVRTCGRLDRGYAAAFARATCALRRAPYYLELQRPEITGDSARTRVDVYFKSTSAISRPVSFVHYCVALRKSNDVWRAQSLCGVATP